MLRSPKPLLRDGRFAASFRMRLKGRIEAEAELITRVV